PLRRARGGSRREAARPGAAARRGDRPHRRRTAHERRGPRGAARVPREAPAVVAPAAGVIAAPASLRRVLLPSAAIGFVDPPLLPAARPPLRPHYAGDLGLGRGGAGVLAAASPAGVFVGAIPSGIVAARAGVKPTVLIGMTVVAVTTALFGVLTEAWQLDLVR